jgi:hypothetical protein
MSTLPLGSSVAVWDLRAVLPPQVPLHVPVAASWRARAGETVLPMPSRDEDLAAGQQRGGVTASPVGEGPGGLQAPVAGLAGVPRWRERCRYFLPRHLLPLGSKVVWEKGEETRGGEEPVALQVPVAGS